ncbi:hypothetical protein ZHAS_00009223 [Anopheles sinensis]|uniref:Uncharacterized protein n=1 Tax=Anopheles sinensis TaxID=74873 RepID=A0A084VUH2_ANOSI|nr:hypothetical protein ZHAS_00009223 [Anopheles sinensis]
MRHFSDPIRTRGGKERLRRRQSHHGVVDQAKWRTAYQPLRRPLVTVQNQVKAFFTVRARSRRNGGEINLNRAAHSVDDMDDGQVNYILLRWEQERSVESIVYKLL